MNAMRRPRSNRNVFRMGIGNAYGQLCHEAAPSHYMHRGNEMAIKLSKRSPGRPLGFRLIGTPGGRGRGRGKRLRSDDRRSKGVATEKDSGERGRSRGERSVEAFRAKPRGGAEKGTKGVKGSHKGKGSGR